MNLTNILCNVVVTLLTNTVESDNSSGCKSFGAMHARMEPFHQCRPYVEATERTVTETVTQRLEVRTPGLAIGKGAMEGDPIVEIREWSRTVKVYRRSQEWVEMPRVPIEAIMTITNRMNYGTMESNVVQWFRTNQNRRLWP